MCADDPRNNGGSLKYCECCGRQSTGTSKEISLDQLIDSAALVGIINSMGTLVNSNLSTDCSRLQKQDQSLAALSCNSYIDIVHSEFQVAATNFIVGHAKENKSELVSEDEYTETTKVTCIFGDEEEEDDSDIELKPIVKEEVKDNPPPDGFVPELVALYNCNKFENEFTRFHLTGAALHAQILKYDKEYTNYTDNISYTYKKSNCVCSKTLVDFLSKNAPLQ